MKTIRDYLDEAAERTPERIAQQFYQGHAWVTRSYGALRDRVVRAAGIVQDLGIVPGRQQVALMLDNGPEWQEIYLALAGSGVAVVPLDPKLRPQEALHILRDSEAVAIFAGAKQQGTLGQVLGHLLDIPEAVRALPEPFMVEREALARAGSEHHGGKPSGANGHALAPVGGGCLIPQSAMH